MNSVSYRQDHLDDAEESMFWQGSMLLTFRVLGLVIVSAGPLRAQTYGTCVPVSERAGREFGCFITAREELGALPAQPPLYWHLDTFPTVAAAQTAIGQRGTVVESLGRIWLFSIADAEYRPTGGTRVARIGPLPLVRAERLAAVYMEGVFQPGAQVHAAMRSGRLTCHALVQQYLHGVRRPPASGHGGVVHAGRVHVSGDPQRAA